MKAPKRRKPWWWKWRVSCPECGYLYDDSSTTDKILTGSKYVQCPRCQTRLSNKEFWELNYSKYDKRADIAISD